ncbi:unnamed protein product [Vicia faba]|uniref:Uncharacterized protein n=1 Tax=Vicia faba TaxID=3906 RepID=A0AAV1AE99_VICFA|nr:unnamed protein product [Vicia faba]
MEVIYNRNNSSAADPAELNTADQYPLLHPLKDLLPVLIDGDRHEGQSFWLSEFPSTMPEMFSDALRSGKYGSDREVNLICQGTKLSALSDTELDAAKAPTLAQEKKGSVKKEIRVRRKWHIQGTAQRMFRKRKKRLEPAPPAKGTWTLQKAQTNSTRFEDALGRGSKRLSQVKINCPGQESKPSREGIESPPR